VHLFRDHDFHPREDTVRVFSHPPAGVLRVDADALVAVARYGDVLLWHFAFRDRWFKVNVTTDRDGGLVETAPSEGAPAFAFNIDLATPLRLEGRNAYAVDLELDVLVRADAVSHVVTDEDDFERSVRAGLISPAEAAHARAELSRLVVEIERGELLALLRRVHSLGPVDAPDWLPVERVPVADVPAVQARTRLTWTA
jgi:predicted RNA-binding protein associated with RNAse of E/G family